MESAPTIAAAPSPPPRVRVELHPPLAADDADDVDSVALSTPPSSIATAPASGSSGGQTADIGHVVEHVESPAPSMNEVIHCA
jgi:hypothetical protein